MRKCRSLTYLLEDSLRDRTRPFKKPRGGPDKFSCQISVVKNSSAFSKLILLAQRCPLRLANFYRRDLYFHFHFCAIQLSSISYDLRTVYR
jgi:hypothetical protein